MSVMITIAGLSTISVMLGATFAYMAGAFPRHQAVMQTVGGILLIGGFGLLGYGRESIFGQP